MCSSFRSICPKASHEVQMYSKESESARRVMDILAGVKKANSGGHQDGTALQDKHTHTYTHTDSYRDDS